MRLERTREVLAELWHSLRRALPILVGVAGPMAVALLAWAGLGPMKAVTVPGPAGLAIWLLQTVAAAWPLWALRERLLPEAWCVQLRCLPAPVLDLAVSDLAVSAAVLAPLGGLYLVGALVFAMQRPPWFVAAWPAALAALAASWIGSCVLGGLVLAGRRRAPSPAGRLPRREPSPAVLLARRPGLVRALLWAPWWRAAMVPGGRSVAVGLGVALALAWAWTSRRWPAVPGAAWALLTGAILLAVTERVQRAMEAHLGRLAPWLACLPLAGGWRWRARALVCAPMVLAGAVIVARVLAGRPWRTGPLVGFALTLGGTPLALTAVPSSRRETHVGLWVIGAGLLSALGSELWD